MTLSTREVVKRLVTWVPEQRWDDLPPLYDEEAVVEQPMALPGPLRLVGRPAIAAHFAAAAQLPLSMRLEHLVLHQTADPDVVIAEFDYVARRTDTAQEFRVANVFVVRAREGRIIESRDYSNHALFAAAFDRLTAVEAALRMS